MSLIRVKVRTRVPRVVRRAWTPERSGEIAAERVGSMRCPAHGEPPGVFMEGGSISVSTCCDEFKHSVLGVLSGV